jgi:hypothetical protein
VVVEVEAIHRAQIGLEDGRRREKDIPERLEIGLAIHLRLTLIHWTIGSVADGKADLSFHHVHCLGQVICRELAWALLGGAGEHRSDADGDQAGHPAIRS